jgi:site-specific DNA-methyltransferase (adenine-specific)
MTIDLRCGRWQDVLTDVECDALILDAPYSLRTHSGHDEAVRNDGHHDSALGPRMVTRPINYAAWTPSDVAECVRGWSGRTRGWIVSLTDHTLATAWADELESAGRYVFAPLPLVEIGSRVRLTGDGPCSWSCWIVVARPRSLSTWGTLPGAYVFKGKGDRMVMGGKRTDAMRALVRDYTRPGDLVCDPCAGGGTTLIAAEIEGRRAVGAEALVGHYDTARARFARGFTPSLFAE